MDNLSKADRSALMARIRSKNTNPERIVRSILHRLGFRFRLHTYDLPGKPDIVLPRHRKIILVHGCFWHSHTGCRLASSPKSNTGYWAEKLARNEARDAEKIAALEAQGYRVLVVWECDVRDGVRLQRALESFFGVTT